MIKYFNRKTREYEVEDVAGEKYLNWLYNSSTGEGLLNTFIKKKLFSSLYGKYCDTSISRKKITSFVNSFNIDMSEALDSIDSYKSFNSFFTRKLLKEKRPVAAHKNKLPSPADGRLLAYENIDIYNLIQVKGFSYSLPQLIKNEEVAKKYKEGTCLIFRLNPTDYHRFHFIDDGICENTVKIKGSYYSVNPIALKKIANLFCENKREWSIFHSENFGEILYVEVGATCVGSIIQTYSPKTLIKRGDEKGYFKFGGSTVILFLEKGKVKINKDILDESNNGFETKVLMGEEIGDSLI